MTGGKLEVAYLFIQTAAALIVLIVCGLLINKAANVYKQYLKKKWDNKNRAYFEQIRSMLGRAGALPTPERKLARAEEAFVQSKLTAWIEQTDGRAREQLIALCEQLGFVDRELARLQSRLSIRKTKAAYRLGMLRSKRAAPALLEQLAKQPFGPSLFIVARSLALCARGDDDLDEMVSQIAKHRKPVHDITASILEEVGAQLPVDAASGNVLAFREWHGEEGHKPKTRAI